MDRKEKEEAMRKTAQFNKIEVIKRFQSSSLPLFTYISPLERERENETFA